MIKDFETWKLDEIVRIENDIQFYERKLIELKMKLKVYKD